MISKKVMPRKKAINKPIDALEVINKRRDEIESQSLEIIKGIRNGYVDAVVVFIDLVGSTQFKVDNKDEPEKWILRLKQFSELITEYINAFGGKVVKYIGDEVMAIFDNETNVNDALNMLMRIDEIQENLSKLTKFTTEIKIAVDKGNVYLLKYDGHEELDPQGTAVDRCARIAKYAKAGLVVSSFEFVQLIKKVNYFEVGNINLKGLGNVSIYQLFEKTLVIEEVIEVGKIEFQQIQKKIQDDTLLINKLKEMNINLEEQVNELGGEPEHDNLFDDGNESEIDLWEEIESSIKEIKNLSSKTGASTNEYFRFLFLYRRGEGQKYDIMQGRTFDRCIEDNLVEDRNGNGYYSLVKDNKLNRIILNKLDDLEQLLEEYSESYPEDEDFLYYECSLNEAKFWGTFFQVNVYT